MLFTFTPIGHVKATANTIRPVGTAIVDAIGVDAEASQPIVGTAFSAPLDHRNAWGSVTVATPQTTWGSGDARALQSTNGQAIGYCANWSEEDVGVGSKDRLGFAEPSIPDALACLEDPAEPTAQGLNRAAATNMKPTTSATTSPRIRRRRKTGSTSLLSSSRSTEPA